MIDVISVNIDSNGKVKTSSKTLCNQYENGVAQFKLNVPPDWQDDSYFYYLCVVPPESAGIKQYAVPLTEEFIFLISSGITWHLGTWKFVFMVLNSELPDTGVVPTEGIVSISDSWEGSVNKSILNLDDLAEQPVDPNFTLLYTDLMALRNSVENIGEYAQAQGDYAKGVGEQLLQDKEDGVFDGEDGDDGVSPTVAVNTSTESTYTLDITDANGTITTPNLKGQQGNPGSPGNDGTSPTVTVHTSTSTEYTLDITDVNGTTTTPNLRGADGSDGQDGTDGTSPTVTVNTNTDTIYKLDITDVNGTITTPNLKGADGEPGTTTYSDLSDKPSINGVTLSGNKTSSALGLLSTSGGEMYGPINMRGYSINDVGRMNVTYTPSATTDVVNKRYADTKETASNKVTTIDANSTDTQYPSAKAVYDYATPKSTYGYVQEPATEGTNGQVLTTDGNGGRSWITVQGGGTSDYTQLTNKPSINSVALTGNKSLSDLGIADKSLYNDTTINTGRAANSTVGNNSAALGFPNTNIASGRDAFTTGIENTASGNDSFAEGEVNTASGEAAHVGGMDSTAAGDMSFAFGDSVEANGEASVALGRYTIAGSDNQFVTGKFNISDSNDAYAEIVGNGKWVTGTGAVRSNARTTDWSGNAWFAGNVYVGSTSGTNKDSGSKKLATEDYIDSLVVDGAKKTMLYNGKASSTAVLSGAIQQLSDSIYNYDMILVGFNCMVQNFGRSMEICDTIYPNNALIDWCDTTGAGASGAHHIYNSNQAHNNLYRIIWGFTDETHIRNIVSAHVNTGTYGWVDEGICYVVGYKFSSLPDGYATEQYVDNAIASAVTSAIGGSY